MNKNKFLILFILCCASPLILAKLVLEFGWFNAGSSSRGSWLQEEVFLLPATQNSTKSWRVAVIAEECDEVCLQALHTVKQLYIGLGRKQNQVQPIYVGNSQVVDYPMFQQLHVATTLSSPLQQKIIIVDQQGLALLSYTLPAVADEMAVTAKAIRADLMKLMNYDRTSV